jgi:hypothetical protein
MFFPLQSPKRQELAAQLRFEERLSAFDLPFPVDSGHASYAPVKTAGRQLQK